MRNVEEQKCELILLGLDTIFFGGLYFQYSASFRLNETHVLLYFMDEIRVVNRTLLDTALSKLLWKRDKLVYILNELGIYKEKKGVIEYKRLTQVKSNILKI